jgi:hypothetical protein
MTDTSASPRLNEYERHLLEEAAKEIDSLWDFKAELGVADSRPGAEYMRLSLAPKLRELAAS